MIPAHKNVEHPAGQVVNRPGEAPISPAKRLGDIIDGVVVARSSEPAPKDSYEQGYKDGWNAAIEASVKKMLDNF